MTNQLSSSCGLEKNNIHSAIHATARDGVECTATKKRKEGRTDGSHPGVPAAATSSLPGPTPPRRETSNLDKPGIHIDLQKARP